MATNPLNDIAATFLSGGTTMILFIVIGVVAIILICLAAWLLMFRKRWNLKVEFKMVRSDGRITVPEWGKGQYDAKSGIIWLKRKGMRMKKEGVKAMRLDRYLQGQNTITVVGNPGNWRIVIPDSFLEVVDTDTGEEATVITLKTDTREDKSWSTYFERLAGQTFTIQSFMAEYGQFIGWGLILMVVIIANFVGFSMVLGKLKG